MWTERGPREVGVQRYRTVCNSEHVPMEVASLCRLIQSHWRPSIATALVVVILVTAVTYGGHPSAHFGDVETPWAESDRSSDVLQLQYPVVRITI